MKRENQQKIKFFTGAALLLICVSLIAICDCFFPDKTLYAGSIPITNTSLSGMLCVMQTASYFLLIAGNIKYGSIISFTFIIVSLFGVSQSIFLEHHYSALPGFFMVIAGSILVGIYTHQMIILQRHDAELKKLSITDSLTGLLNRAGIYEEINRRIENNKPFYLLFLDLDNFKLVNDSIGHRAGDILLQRVGRHWQSIDNPEGVFGRNGGDEFLMVVPEKKDFDINIFMNKCFEALQGDIYLDEYDFNYKVSVSIGVSYFPLHGRTADDLVKAADDAMYRVKADGGDNFKVFTSSEKF